MSVIVITWLRGGASLRLSGHGCRRHRQRHAQEFFGEEASTAGNARSSRTSPAAATVTTASISAIAKGSSGCSPGSAARSPACCTPPPSPLTTGTGPSESRLIFSAALGDHRRNRDQHRHCDREIGESLHDAPPAWRRGSRPRAASRRRFQPLGIDVDRNGPWRRRRGRGPRPPRRHCRPGTPSAISRISSIPRQRSLFSEVGEGGGGGLDGDRLVDGVVGIAGRGQRVWDVGPSKCCVIAEPGTVANRTGASRGRSIQGALAAAGLWLVARAAEAALPTDPNPSRQTSGRCS